MVANLYFCPEKLMHKVPVIPLARPSLGEEEIAAVVSVLRSGLLSMGPWIEAFEESFAHMLGAKYAVAVSSGTAGLHLGLEALGIGPGDEVITSPFSFVASANSILYTSATPVFVDIEEVSLGLDPNLIPDAITDRTRAILPVHVFGQACNMRPIMGLAQRQGYVVVEDSCESIRALHHGRAAGTLGDCGVFGFYPNKQLATGEGGMITTNNESLYCLLRSLRNQGRGLDTQWLHHERLGYNYRLSELHAALGYVQTQRLPEILHKRSAIAGRYCELLADVNEIRLPSIMEGNTHSWFVYAVRVPENIRDALIEFLGAEGIQSKAYFSPCIHLQPYFRERYGYREGMFPVAERLSKEVLILPFYTDMTGEDVQKVVHTLKQGLWTLL